MRNLTVFFRQIAVEMKAEQTPPGAFYQNGRFVFRGDLLSGRVLVNHR